MRSPLRLLLAVLAAAIALGATTGSALAAPTNDDFANAEALSGNRGIAFIDLTDATVESGEPASPGTDERTVWFAYTPTANGYVSFSFCDYDPAYEIAGAHISAFTGSSVGALIAEDSSLGGCPAGFVNAAVRNMAVTAGTTYSIQIGSTNASEIVGAALIYDFNSSLPTNDSFTSAQTISGSLPQTIDADNGLATTETDEPGVDLWGPFNSLWYRWTPSADGVVSIDTCSTESENPAQVPDSRLQLFSSSNDPADFAGLNLSDTYDDGCGSPNPLLSRGYRFVSSGTEYWIRLVNSNDKFGAPYKLKLRWITTPEISGAPSIFPQADSLPIGQPASAEVPDWHADPSITAVDIQWQLCNSEGNNCGDIVGATDTDYTPVAGDAGKRLRIKVTGSNGVESTVAYSDASAPVETPVPPIVDPPAPPPAPPIVPPVDPFPAQTLPKSLGKIKLSKKNVVTLSKLNLVCGETATGPCTGSITFTTAKAKKNGKTIKSVKQVVKLTIAPRRTMPTTFKLSSAMVKAVKAAKSLKTSIAIQLGAPSFSSKSLSTGATVSLK